MSEEKFLKQIFDYDQYWSVVIKTGIDLSTIT